MAKGLTLKNEEREFLKEKFAGKHRDKVNVEQNSNAEFDRALIQRDINDNREASGSTWRDLFHRKGEYNVLQSTLDKFYTHLFGMGRGTYLEKHPDLRTAFVAVENGEDLTVEEIETNSLLDPLTADENTALRKLVADLQNKDTINSNKVKELNLTIEDLTKREDALHKVKKRLNNALIILAYAFFCGVLLNLLTFNRLRRAEVWGGVKENIDKTVLLNDVEFLKDSTSKFYAVVDSLVKNLIQPQAFDDKFLAIIPYDSSHVIEGGKFKKHGIHFYPQQMTSKLFGKYPASDHVVNGMKAYLGRNYDKIVNADGPTKIDALLLAKIIGIENTHFDADLIYIGISKEDTLQGSMHRYPRYELDMNLGNYNMITRQWWLEATKKIGINWRHSFNGQEMSCGLSKSYATVRIGAPNQRTFWVEIPTKTTYKMVLAIDLFLKN